jgi:hypothetical protein
VGTTADELATTTTDEDGKRLEIAVLETIAEEGLEEEDEC